VQTISPIIVDTINDGKEIKYRTQSPAESSDMIRALTAVLNEVESLDERARAEQAIQAQGKDLARRTLEKMIDNPSLNGKDGVLPLKRMIDKVVTVPSSNSKEGSHLLVKVDYKKQTLIGLIDTGTRHTLMSMATYNTLEDPPELVKSDYTFSVADGNQSKACGQMSLKFKIGSKRTTQTVFMTPSLEPLFLVGMLCLNEMGLDTIGMHPPRLVFEDGNVVKLEAQAGKGTYYMRLSQNTKIPANGEVLMPVYLDPRCYDAELKLAMCHTSDELWDNYPVIVKEGITQVRDGFAQVNLKNTSDECILLPGGTLVSDCTDEEQSQISSMVNRPEGEFKDNEKEEYFKYLKEQYASTDSGGNKPEGNHRKLKKNWRNGKYNTVPVNSDEFAEEICEMIPSAQEGRKKSAQEEEELEEQYDKDAEEDEISELNKKGRSVGTQTENAMERDGLAEMEIKIKQNEFEDDAIKAPNSLAGYISKHVNKSDKTDLLAAIRKIPERAYEDVGEDPMDESSEDETTLPHMKRSLKEDGYEDMFMPQKIAGIKEVREDGKLLKHMEDMYKRHLPFIPKERHRDLYDLLVDTQDCYRNPYSPQTVSDVDEHAIDTEDNKPFKLRPRRLPSAMTEVVDKEIQEMLDNKVISGSESPWASAIVLVKKKDGSIRFCIDYRVLNLKTKKDSYPLPRIDQCLEALQGAKYFCSLDLASGYWQIKMHEKDKEKTAFSCPRGHFEFNVMPFGLCNAPATFQRIMDKILVDLVADKICVTYLDDIIIVGKSLDDCFNNYLQVVNRFAKYNLKLKQSKCNLFRRSVNFLGHIISDRGIATDPAKVRKVELWPEPTRLGHIRSFLGLTCYYQRFIPDYGSIVEPLQRLTRKDIKFAWKDEQQKSFDTLKKLLMESPILAYPIDGEMFILDTDASNVAIGAVLSQMQGNEERVIAYGTKSLNPGQQNYCTTKRELYAVFHFVAVKFRNYLLGRIFKIRTDHSSLKWLMNFKQHDALLNRWVMALATYSNRWILEHRSGKSHLNADAMSRISTKFCRRALCPHCLAYREKDRPIVPVQAEIDDMIDYCKQPKEYWDKVNRSNKKVEYAAVVQDVDESDEDEELVPTGPRELLYSREQQVINSESDEVDATHKVHVTTDRGNEVPIEINKEEPLIPNITPRDLAILQDQDVDICRFKILLSMYGHEKPPNKQMRMESRRVKNFVLFWEEMRYHEGVLYKEGWDNDYRLVTPFSLQELLLKQVHGSSGLMGHPGETKAKLILCKHFYWPGMRKDITSWIHCCMPCRLVKRGKVNRSVMEKSFTGERNFRVGIDIIGPLPETKRGNRFILTICDYFTKWVECVPLSRHTGSDVAEAMFNTWICRIGIPSWIHSDQGSDFESEVMTHLCSMLKISKTRTNPYRPRSAGLVERHNGTIKRMIETAVDGQRDEWDLHLPVVTMAYRAMPHASTGFSPNMMMFGQENTNTLDLIFPPGPVVKELRDGVSCYCKYISFLRKSLIRTHEIAREKLQMAADHMQFHHDKSAHVLRDFKKGDWVLYWHKPTAQKSLSSGWTGPYLVVRKVNDFTFTIMRDEYSAPTNVHGDFLYLDANHNRPCTWLETLTKEDIETKGRRARFMAKTNKNNLNQEWLTLEKFQDLEERRNRDVVVVPETEKEDLGTRTTDGKKDPEGAQAPDDKNEYIGRNLRSSSKRDSGTRTMISEEPENINDELAVNDHNKVIEAAIEKEKKERRRNLTKKRGFMDLNPFQDVRSSMRLKSKDRIDYDKLHHGDDDSDSDT
jgi:hypothetical protein